MTNPVLAYDHSNGCAIVGGVVVHADDLPSLAGRYVYGDNCGGWVHSAVLAQPQVTDDRDEGLSVTNLYSFGQDKALRPERLRGVHRAAVALEVDDRSISLPAQQVRRLPYFPEWVQSFLEGMQTLPAPVPQQPVPTAGATPQGFEGRHEEHHPGRSVGIGGNLVREPKSVSWSERQPRAPNQSACCSDRRPRAANQHGPAGRFDDWQDQELFVRQDPAVHGRVPVVGERV